MAELFKNLINPQTVQRLAQRLSALWPAFGSARFTALACTGLDSLEMKGRAMQICSALEATLPQDFDSAAALLQASVQGDQALDGWVLWAVGEYVARRGLQQPVRALQLLHAMTQRFTAEFAIRPFIQAHPALVFDTLALHFSQGVQRLEPAVAAAWQRGAGQAPRSAPHHDPARPRWPSRGGRASERCGGGQRALHAGPGLNATRLLSPMHHPV